MLLVMISVRLASACSGNIPILVETSWAMRLVYQREPMTPALLA